MRTGLERFILETDRKNEFMLISALRKSKGSELWGLKKCMIMELFHNSQL